MFSRNDVSINEVRYPEISPTVKEIPEGEDDDVREIHNLEVESKRSYFSNFSVDWMDFDGMVNFWQGNGSYIFLDYEMNQKIILIFFT